jgi:Double zinc ribbon
MALDTRTCPRCRQLVNPQAVTCPYCRTELKAYGHPGIPLHRAKENEYLCDSCTYHADDTCNFPQRPYAKDCTLYQNIEQSKLDLQQQREQTSFGVTVKKWVQQNQALLLLLALLLVCLLVTLFSS